MSRKILSVSFLADLVKYHGAVTDKLSPLGDFESARATVISNLASGTSEDAAFYRQVAKSDDAMFFERSPDEGFALMYVATLVIKEKLIPASWTQRSVQDWMYVFSKQIWAINAKKDDFGPVKFKDESEDEWTRRRALGAKRSLAQLDEAEIPLVSNARDFMSEVAALNKSNVAKALGLTYSAIMALESGSMAAAGPQLLSRASTIAKGQVPRLEKICDRLNELYRRLTSIAASEE